MTEPPENPGKPQSILQSIDAARDDIGVESVQGWIWHAKAKPLPSEGEHCQCYSLVAWPSQGHDAEAE